MAGPVFELPTEPPVGTIVLDALGRAVQRTASSGWLTASSRAGVPAKDWAGVLSAGPVTVVYAPEGAEMSSPSATHHDELVRILRKAIRVRGGNVQAVLGSDPRTSL